MIQKPLVCRLAHCGASCDRMTVEQMCYLYKDITKCPFYERRDDFYEKESKSDWIPCSERLPNTDDEVLCWYEYYHWSQEKVLPEYGLGHYLREASAWSGEVSIGKDVRVIAWMPLPKPYKESEDKDAP